MTGWDHHTDRTIGVARGVGLSWDDIAECVSLMRPGTSAADVRRRDRWLRIRARLAPAQLTDLGMMPDIAA